MEELNNESECEENRLTLEDVTADNGRRYVTMEMSLTGGIGTEPR